MKNDMFESVLNWKKALSEKGLPTGGTSEVWSDELGQKLAEIIMDGVVLAIPSTLSDSDHLKLSNLLPSLNLAGIAPADVLVVCEAGSRLYNLALPTSDVDYIVIFRHPTTTIISSVLPLKVLHIWFRVWP